MFAENKTIHELKSMEAIVECLGDFEYGNQAVRLIELCEGLKTNYYNNYLKISCIPYLFHAFENIVNSDQNPAELFCNELKNLLNYLDCASKSKMMYIYKGAAEFSVSKEETNVELATGDHYGKLFKGFTPEKYFYETKELLLKRLEINKVDISNIKNWIVLDQGCGGGRYTVAWALLGAKKVIGIDISTIGIYDAKKRAKLANINNVKYIEGNVLNLPFKNNKFDVVFSNGVLHHTQDWKLGIKEQLRVLKKGGMGWQYLIEQPGGIFWDKIEILRMIVRNINKDFAIEVMKGFGISTNRIFYMLDHVMVPINTRVTSQELKNELMKSKAINISRLKRGVGFDRVEYINKKVPYANRKFGVGENRFVFSK